MNQYFRLPSGSASMSIGYITCGVLTIIWAGVWLTWISTHGYEASWPYYVCTGLLFSGAALVVIGMLMGKIGHQAKGADSDTAAPVQGNAIAQPAAPVQPQQAGQVVMMPVQQAPVAASPQPVGTVPQSTVR